MTYVTSGYPTPEDTVDILLGMEAGGAGNKQNPIGNSVLTNPQDVIELGLPFTDPIADGPTIQKANTVSIPLSCLPAMQDSNNCTASAPKRCHCQLDS